MFSIRNFRTMERKVLFYWLAQFIGWGAYYVFSAVLLISIDIYKPNSHLYYWLIMSILFSVLVSHGLRFLILRRDILGKKLWQIIFISIVAALICASLLETFQNYGISYLIGEDFMVGGENQESPPFSISQFLFAVSRSLILFLLWMGFYYVFVIIEKSRKQEIASLQWEASKSEIELKNLRAQINPHFLFNSLNSIRALVGLNPDQAKQAITHLSILLRESINLGKLEVISLQQELDLVKSYLDLEQIRFEERLEVQMDIASYSIRCKIPPLMVQTIVENAIKHGISKIVEGGVISVKSTYKEEELVLDIANTGVLDLTEASQGIGIENSRKRLEILFGEKAQLDIFQDHDLVRVLVKIKYT